MQKVKVPKCIRLLSDWKATTMTVVVDNVGHVIEYFMSPKKRVYQRSASWEQPDLLIDSPVIPASDSIRLTRVRNKKLIKAVRRAIRGNRSGGKMVRLRSDKSKRKKRKRHNKG